MPTYVHLPRSYLGVAAAEEEEAGVRGRGVAATEETGGVESSGDLESLQWKAKHHGVGYYL
jgi:hypothetical protein